MDLLEGKLKRLRELRALQCCKHIDHEIKSWLNSIEQPPPQPPPPELSVAPTPAAKPIATTTTSNEATTTSATIDPTTTTTLTATTITTTTATTPTDPAALSTASSLSIPTSSVTDIAPHNNTTTPSPPPTPPPSHSQETTITTSTKAPSTKPQPKTYLTKEEIEAYDEKAISCFLSNIKHLESLDSDATESTSSNDSYDELEGFSHAEIPPKKIIPHPYMKSHYPSSNASTQRQQRMSTSSLSQVNHQGNSLSHRRASHQHSLDGVAHSSLMNAVDGSAPHMSDLKQKAIWKWARERGRLASKWTWLQAQIADLEFRVRGQNDSLMQARVRKVQPIPQVLPESTCSRTVPLNKDFRQRRLIKSSQILSDSSKSSVKFSHVPCVCSSLPQTLAPCLSCKGRYNYLKQSEGENVPLLERASLLDPGCHPVLSFPDDITLGSQLSYLLRQETVIRKPMKGKPGRKKGSTAANSANAASNDDKLGNKYVTKKGKFYQNISNRQTGHSQSGHLKNPSQTMIASNKLKRKYRKHSNNPNYDSNNWFNGNYHAHSNNSTKRNKRIRSASSMNESSLHSDSSNPCRPNHFTNNAARTVTRRRRSEQSAYDIDNIVIPFSVAATTRVEILEYKEIMTPSWRVWENGTCLNDINNVSNEPPEDMEDTSDEAYILRHTKGEHEEKKRFSLKPPPKNESHNAVPRE